MGAYIFISVLIFIACLLLIIVVLIQDSKGGGLASNFSASNQVMGVRKTADFLEKSTWTLAIALVGLSLLSIFVIPRGQTVSTYDSQLIEYFDQTQPVDYSQPPATQGRPGVQQQPGTQQQQQQQQQQQPTQIPPIED